MPSPTTLKLPEKLKARVTKLALATNRTPHGMMIEAIEREVEREERYRAFVKEAIAADLAIDKGAPVYAANDVHAWMERLATDANAPRPAPQKA
ncbi:MAG: CopG family transcriptional regulator [Burkholderiales bacterium]